MIRQGTITRALEPIATTAVVIGGGIAGTWCALKLAKRNIPVVLLTYQQNDRGGLQGSTTRSVGAINLAPINQPNLTGFMDQMSHGLSNHSIAPILASGLAHELEELKAYTPLKEIKIGLAIACSAKELLSKLLLDFKQHGGGLLNGWVTRINAVLDGSRGVQYQNEHGIGQVAAQHIVIATGGYANLYAGSLNAANYGTMLGHFLRCGGLAANMEFIFKHGYGKPDQNKLIPTEELKGAAIVNQNDNHVDWLERELFDGKGTFSHQRVVRFWRSHRRDDHYVNLSYRPLYDKITRLNTLAADTDRDSTTNSIVADAVNDLLSDFPSGIAPTLRQRIMDRVTQRHPIDYDLYKVIRPYYIKSNEGDAVSRIRQIAYFSMGGIAHVGFKTNLRHVYVTGEAMHDFGANPVGGLPWGLYLVAGSKIARDIKQAASAIRTDHPKPAEIEICTHLAHFDQRILSVIRKLLYRYQENYFSADPAKRTINRLRHIRRSLVDDGHEQCDAVSWLLVAEGVMASSLARKESRGCFYRDDIPHEDPEYSRLHSCAYYDKATDAISVELVSPELYTAMLTHSLNPDQADA